MAKVFRLHSGKDTIVDWQDSSVYGSDAISQIEDPEGGTASKEITSIPSPFARIDIVKNAFKIVSDTKNLDGDTIYNKAVSDSLDVGEIFFNIDKLRDKVQIIVWDLENDLNALLKSKNDAHRTLGETLDMYLKQDAAAYNFNKLKRIYLLNYIGPGRMNQMNIIGATSPCTLFFSSANNLQFVANNITFGQDKPFDSQLQPLYKRDIEYINYLFAFRASYPNFSTDFREFNAYLDETYTRLSDEYKNEISKITASTINDYQGIDVITNNNFVEILGTPLHKRQIKKLESQFELSSTIYEGVSPLVLPAPLLKDNNTSKYEDLIFTSDKWNQNYKAPYFNDTPWQERTLPYILDKHPYLSISDFLEDTIVKMPYKLNSGYFFDGNITKGGDVSYILPIKNLFFEFFTVEELMGDVPCGKRMIEIEPGIERVLVTLRIPIKGNNFIKYIEYQRNYFENSSVDIDSNKGSVESARLGLGLFPVVRFKENENPHYRIALCDKTRYGINLSPYCGINQIGFKSHVFRSEKDQDNDNSVESYVLDQNFDRISVSIGTANGFIIPKLRKCSNNAEFTFAVDFGTTNTHIEYSVNGNPPEAFNMNIEDQQFQKLHVDYLIDRVDFEPAFEHNFIPESIGEKDSLYRYPIRTAFAEDRKINYAIPVNTLANGNIPFRYQNDATPRYNQIVTNLKWNTKDKERVRMYIDNIYMLLRNKVVLNGGNLSKTKIIWFYPASMTEAQCNKFKEIWTSSYKLYFGNETSNVISMSESTAPYYYYSKKAGAKSKVVTIDIGGGTTDVFVAENREPKLLTSFRFASNSIFGDGYNYDSDNNGFIKYYHEEFVNSLNSNNLLSLISALEQIEKQKNSVDITAFYFSLANNRLVTDSGVRSLNFLDKLSENEELKYVFIIFYSSIFFHVARTMKAKELEMPLTIAFSGNGSKTLAVLSPDNNIITQFAKLIFEGVFNKKYDSNNSLTIIFDGDKPKESTCKGGVLNPVMQDFDSINNIKYSLLGDYSDNFTRKQNIEDIDENVLKSVVKQVEYFIDFIFDIDNRKEGFFSNKFGADARIKELVKDVSKKNLIEYALLGIQLKKEELINLGTDEKLDETLFFFPIIGMLNNLAREIYNN